MFKNYLKVAVRNLLKNKVYSLINIVGLSLGMTCTLLIYLWITDELSYDAFHKQADRIYLVTEEYKFADKISRQAKTPYPLAPLMKNNLAGVEKFVRIDNIVQRNQYCKINNEVVEIVEPDRIGFADSTFFNFFSFPLVKGDPSRCLNAPNGIVLSEQKAHKYFGAKDPIGQNLTLTNVYNGFTMDLRVTGVMENMPSNSHLNKDLLISMSTIDTNRALNFRVNNWNFATQYTYVMFNAPVKPEVAEASLKDILVRNTDKFTSDTYTFNLLPLRDIYLRSDLDANVGQTGDIRYVYLFGIIALLTLVISAINYMNLATARSSMRAKEVGLRKVVGAERRQIITQLLVESFITTLLALVISYILVFVLLPYFNVLSGKQLSFNGATAIRLLLIFVPLLLIVSLVAGSYPAFYLSSFHPARILKGTFSSLGFSTTTLRKALVVFQFTASIILITSTIVIYNQWQFLRNKKLGLNPGQVITLPVQSMDFVNKYAVFKEDLLKNASIISVSGCNKNITEKFQDFTSTYVNNSDQQYVMAFGAVDFDFFESLGIDFVEGRSFSKNHGTDMTEAVIINESARKFFSLDKPLGNLLRTGSQRTPKTIIGVVKDFHFEDLHTKIAPMIFFPTPNYINTVFVKARMDNPDKVLADIERVFKSYRFREPFRYAFLDETVANLYRSEQRFLNIFIAFSMLAVFIASLGLFGLVAFMAQQRTKEIGIRKVVGASVGSIVAMLSKDFIRLVLIAAAIAFPVAWWSLNKWLEDFAYRVDITWYTFVLAGVIAVIIAMITLSFQAVKAALASPVKSLRTE